MSFDWKPIETAPRDNERPLLLSILDENGKLLALDFDGSWESESESWELPQLYYFWMSANDIQEPTHWDYQE